MTTMSDEGERLCPLCTEEMDLTDQQLKPCKCGYQICVWCWHHIIDMAEKDNTEGRCPACRAPYDKEKVVGMEANCERIVTEINLERRLKSQKAKTKASEGRKHLSSVRVIQRNLVYIIGIPNSLADEDTLERKEYFGQYGKVLKVSITRTASGGQHSSNNTCSVYITYSKEEEAVRCIQSVNGFVLEGRSLRACFGTTKYCNTWLRNMPCNNPDCVYLHDIGSQDDSFTKDEIISAYTRVQQITGCPITLQRRSGNVLPPPADEFCHNGTGSGKLTVKSALNCSVNQVKASPPNGSSGRSIALPAAASWGSRVSNCRPPAASTSGFQVPAKQISDTFSSPSDFSSGIASTTSESILHTDVGKRCMVTEESRAIHSNGRSRSLDSSQYSISDTSEEFIDSACAIATSNNLSSPPAPDNKDRGITMLPYATSSVDPSRHFHSSSHEYVSVDYTVERCSGPSSINNNSNLGVERPDISKHHSSVSNHLSTSLSGNLGVQPDFAEVRSESLTNLPLEKEPVMSENPYVSRELSDWSLEFQIQALPAAASEVKVSTPAHDDQGLNSSDVITHPSYLPYSCGLQNLNYSSGCSWQHTNANSTSHLSTVDSRTMAKKEDESLLSFAAGGSTVMNGYEENKLSSSTSELGKIFERLDVFSDVDNIRYIGKSNDHISDIEKSSVLDMGESSIISNILSMDIPWDDSLTSPKNLAKLLSDTDKHGPLIASPWKPQTSNQSRFSFARHDNFVNQATHLEPSFTDIGHIQKKWSAPQDFMENRDSYGIKHRNGFTNSGLEDFDTLINSSHSLIPSHKSAVSRTQISVPPGFSVSRRAPPPGFSSQERIDHSFGNTSGNHLFESLSLPREQYQVPITGNIGIIGDVEFIDPAILAVGKGTLPPRQNNVGLDLRSSLSQQISTSGHDPRLQLLMQQPIPTHQNLRVSDHIGDRFSSSSDAYAPSRFIEQPQGRSLSPFAQMSLQQSRNSRMSNNQLDWLNGGVQTSNEFGMVQVARNESVGFNKHLPAYEEVRFRMPSSGDLYSRAYGL